MENYKVTLMRNVDLEKKNRNVDLVYFIGVMDQKDQLKKLKLKSHVVT